MQVDPFQILQPGSETQDQVSALSTAQGQAEGESKSGRKLPIAAPLD